MTTANQFMQMLFAERQSELYDLKQGVAWSNWKACHVRLILLYLLHKLFSRHHDRNLSIIIFLFLVFSLAVHKAEGWHLLAYTNLLRVEYSIIVKWRDNSTYVSLYYLSRTGHWFCLKISLCSFNIEHIMVHKPKPPRFAQSTILVVSSPNFEKLALKSLGLL